MRAAAVKATPVPRPRCLLCGEELGAARDAQGTVSHWKRRAERAEGTSGARWKASARLLWQALDDARASIRYLKEAAIERAEEREQERKNLRSGLTSEITAEITARVRAEERRGFNDYLAEEAEATRRMLLRRDRIMGQRRALVRRLVAEVRRLREQGTMAKPPADCFVRHGVRGLTHIERHAMATLFRAEAASLVEQAGQAAASGDAHEARRLELRAQVATLQVRSLCTLQAVAASTEDQATREHWRPLFAREAAEVERLEVVARAACSALPLRPWEAPDERVTPTGSPTESTDQPNH